MKPQEQQLQNSATSHATGPWRVRAIRGAAGRSKRVWVESGDAVIIAEVYSGIGLFGKQPFALLKEEIDESKDANARLIAAAPELLNGCNALLGLLQLVNSNRDTPPWIRDALTNNHRINEARAAVAKVEGVQGSEERAEKANVETPNPLTNP